MIRFTAIAIVTTIIILLCHEILPTFGAVKVPAATGNDPCQDYSLHDCDNVAECYSEQPGYFQCRCPTGYVDVSPDKSRNPGRKCKKEVDECSLGTHECDSNADCLDTTEGYTCRCKMGYTDISANLLTAPGRQCKRSEQCKKADCAPEAECEETPSGPLCHCTSGYVDISKQHGRQPGRVCRIVINECTEHKHDCPATSACINTADGFTCRCNDGYRDDSPNSDRPGRICTKTTIPDSPECNVNDPMSCNKQKHEVCLFKNGTYRCACPTGYQRLPDGRCLVINECENSKLNTCSPDAECVDLAEGYTCQCKSGFADASQNGETGRLCRRRVNECSNPQNFGVDCDANAICVDTEEGYACRCRPGFADISEFFNRLPGRKCVEAINECLDSNLNDCHENALCEDAKEGYICTCRQGFVDVSSNITHYPGRVCTKPKNEIEISNFSHDACDPKASNICPTNAICSKLSPSDDFTCNCAQGSIRHYDGTCRQIAACESDADCDKNAKCANVFDSFKCQCKPGFYDVSPDPDVKPGRVCKELINECAKEHHDCSPFAECIDTTDSYACVCINGFTDSSSAHGLLPGRKCTNSSNECLEKSLNTCDENADCIDTPDSYSCQCFDGYVDVSSNAHLPPGRVCTVQTTCPKQKTDLMFLIDGSGSIGSYVFKHEVLRFVRDFLELFDVGLDNTRVGLIQYSDQIRHEFDLNQYGDKQSLLQAIAQTQYLTGLTRTGAAIQHMVVEGFSERRGARPISGDVSRVAIVITDGRSQDNVTEPAKAARNLHVNTFSIGVTDHVLASELESIAGSPKRWFYVDRFKDLDMRLRSIIQKLACPPPELVPRPPGLCNADSQTGCDRTLNEVCIEINGKSECQCPKQFQRHPLTHICGGELCNPDVRTSCPHPDTCERTPFGNYRCICPLNYARDVRTGICLSTLEPSPPSANNLKECSTGLERNPRTGKCILPGSCDPTEQFPCDVRKREKCLIHNSGRYHTCQCSTGEKRHPVTDVCLINECLSGKNDCAKVAICTDTDDGYICSCPPDHIDQSPDLLNKPGRICSGFINECENNQLNDCSPDSICTDTSEGYVCRCKTGYVDFSPNPHKAPGLICKKEIDECRHPQLNTCHVNAICVDTVESYSCICKPGYTDLNELQNPGRNCQKVQQNNLCDVGKNDCDRNSRCVLDGDNEYRCLCLPGFKDKSPDLTNKPGRVCIPLIPECDNPSLNDCDSPDRAFCLDTDDGYTCGCKHGFLDISPNISIKPGRLCKKLENECLLNTHDCARDGGICEDTPDSYTCRCAVNYLDVSIDRINRPGRNCKKLTNECVTGQNDCSSEAKCTDTEDSYICACRNNYIDVSPDVINKPGRRCLLNINECIKNLHDCSPNANCHDTPEGFNCDCIDGFVDESPDSNKPGRICRPELVDECRMDKHDCHTDAECHDLPFGYTCQCRSQFFDSSPNKATQPGRVCTPRPTPPPEECRLDVSSSCKVELNEVCRIINGLPKCACPINYNRDPKTKACTLINECQFPQLNDCHPNAKCVDTQDSYTCKCLPNFKDLSADNEQPGRNCQPLVNECQFAHLNDCHQKAQCIDLPDGYDCKCLSGFKDISPERPGRICQQLINECQRSDLNSCHKDALCTDLENGYKCACKNNFLDISPSPTLPGRACRPIVNECLDEKLNDCDKTAKCLDTIDSYTCECPQNSKDISPNPAFPGRACHVFVNECLEGKHDCDPNALCHDNEQSYTCECQEQYTDRSPNKMTRPGRICVKLINECKEGRHTCSQQAECRDLEEGYTCECKDGYVDRSPNLATQPGRVCGTPETCPSNHECSSAAICEPLGGNEYKCTCIQGYVDQSPAGTQGRICVRNNACRDAKLNNCSRNAICYDEAKGYRCECIRGYLDKSIEGSPRGRVCEPPTAPQASPRHPCQDPNLNDCHSFGACRAIGAQSYTCECLSGYADRSPDLKNKPGRVCVLTEPICLDAGRNDCHNQAICSEIKNSTDGYTCRCRDGYVDQSPDTKNKPGRVCVEQVNECLDRSLNDCDHLAICEDLPDGYTCRCQLNSIDQSIDSKRPGRKCFAKVNECDNPQLNNCSRFADCFDKDNGYECKCRNGYYDQNPETPGINCKFILNECESPHLTDCGAHSKCIDTTAGYDCQCIAPYREIDPINHPGRQCRYNECLDPKANTCDKENANCKDTEDGYLCSCKDGFYDASENKLEAGRICLAYSEEPKQEIHPLEESSNTVPCGLTQCRIKLGEVCVSGIYCACPPNQGRSNSNSKCQDIEKTPLAVRVLNRGQQPLLYSSEYGNPKNEEYVAFANEFQKDLGRAIGSTIYAPRYVNTDVSLITHPKTVNSSWPDGLLVNFTVGTTPTKNPVDKCDLWDQLMESIQRTNGQIGSGRLNVAADVDQLDPCAKPLPRGNLCGGAICHEDLGEICIVDGICGCSNGEKRANPKDKCRPVESWTLPLWVIRKNHNNLIFNETFANPEDLLNKEYVKSFETGIAQCYPHTELRNGFVTAEVNDIVNPMNVNASWDTGILFNSTMYFRKGVVKVPSDAYYILIRYIVEKNNYQVGESGLYLNPYQPDPFKACYKNDCHPKGICIDLGPNAYRCECANSYRDKNPSDPGRDCLPTKGHNECENPKDNECSENARCIDLDYLYKCECLKGFSDAAPPGTVPGSVCNLDYCSDVNYCPINSTCINLEQEAKCECKKPFVDIRSSDRRIALGMAEDNYCLHPKDVDYCALGLTNCSGVAICKNLNIGYTCECPTGYIDGNPTTPGRICGALLCDLCNQHGDCVHNAQTNNITCSCTEGFSGAYCQIAPSSVPLILLILLAILFLLLTLCCLLYLCTKCHCFKRYREARAFPWNTLDQSASSDSAADFNGSDLYGIPRAKLRGSENTDANAQQLAKYLDDNLRIPRARLHDTSSLGSGSSEFTIREEIERRIITDVTKTELHTTTAENSAVSGGGGGGGEEAVTTHYSSTYSGGGGGGGTGATNSAAMASAQNVSMRSGAHFDEQERGESVAEFANSRGEWKTGVGAFSSSQANDFSHGRRHVEDLHQDDRSIGAYSTEDDGVYDKNILVTRHHELDPDQGLERFKNEIKTTKNYSETYHK